MRIYAGQASEQGDVALRRRLLEADLRMFSSLPEGDIAIPELALRRGLTLAALGEWPKAHEMLRSTNSSTPESQRLRRQLQELSDNMLRHLRQQLRELSDKMLRQCVTAIVSMIDRVLFMTNERKPEAWAATMLSMVRSACEVLGIREPLVAEIDWIVLGYAQVAAKTHRSEGDLQKAKKDADRVFAYARLLLARYPDRSASHLAMSDAYSQICKNAWRDDDRVAIQRNLKLALDEARRALSLDSTNARAAHYVPEYERRLRELVVQQ